MIVARALVPGAWIRAEDGTFRPVVWAVCPVRMTDVTGISAPKEERSMKQLINARHIPCVGIDVRKLTFDDAWVEAERYGRVSIEMPSIGDRYQATIMTRTPGGSLLFARGRDDDRVNALLDAIDEAKRHDGRVP